MKNKKSFQILTISFLMSLSFLSILICNPTQEDPKEVKPFYKYTLKGQIKSPHGWEKIPEFRIFFQGRQTTNNEDGFFTFPLGNQKIDTFSILISKYTTPTFEDFNTVANIGVSSEKTYKLFSFEKTVSYTKTGTADRWEKQEVTFDDDHKTITLPENCITLVINPKYVEDIQDWDVKLLNNFITIPTIILKEDVKEDKLKREAAKSLLYSLDSQPFHESVTEDKQLINNDQMVISLVK